MPGIKLTVITNGRTETRDGKPYNGSINATRFKELIKRGQLRLKRYGDKVFVLVPSKPLSEWEVSQGTYNKKLNGLGFRPVPVPGEEFSVFTTSPVDDLRGIPNSQNITIYIHLDDIAKTGCLIQRQIGRGIAKAPPAPSDEATLGFLVELWNEPDDNWMNLDSKVGGATARAASGGSGHTGSPAAKGRSAKRGRSSALPGIAPALAVSSAAVDTDDGAADPSPAKRHRTINVPSVTFFAVAGRAVGAADPSPANRLKTGVKTDSVTDLPDLVKTEDNAAVPLGFWGEPLQRLFERPSGYVPDVFVEDGVSCETDGSEPKWDELGDIEDYPAFFC